MPKYTYRQQLLSTKTVAKIAKQVHNDEVQKLIKRQYLFSAYNPNTNLWRELDPLSEIVPWASPDKMVCISILRQVDNATNTNLAVVDDPNTMRNEATQALSDGINVVAPEFPLQMGRRTSDTINVYAVSALVRLRVVRDQPSTYTDKVKFRFGFYTWTKIDSSGYLDNTNDPDITSLVKWLPFGYSSQLDNVEAGVNYQGIPYATKNLNMIMNSEKVRTLVEKEITLNISSIQGSVNATVVRLYKEFKNPIKIQYDSLNNQDGRKHLNQKIYFAIRSDVPQIITQESIEPRCQVCTKMYYTNHT